MKKKILVVFFSLNLISLVSCILPCEDYAFYDYSGIYVLTHNPYVIESDSLYLEIGRNDVEYLASRISNFNLGNNLYAYSCDKGGSGPKYPLTRISITSDSNFNSNFPANSELNELITVYGINSDDEYVMGNLNDFIPSKVNSGHFFFPERPDISSTHKITFEFEKSNGEIVSATSELITWE